MLGFGPVGTTAVATGPNNSQTVNVVLIVDHSSYAVTVNAVTFSDVENISPAAFVVTAQGVTLKDIEAVSASSFALSASSVSFKYNVPIAATSIALTANALAEGIKEAIGSASFAISTVAPTFSFNWPIASAVLALTANTVREVDTENVVGPATFSISFADVPLFWIGRGVDVTAYIGGVGHFKYEAERARQLAKITRKPPPAVDLRTNPTFPPIGRPPIARPAPLVDLAAIQNQRMAAQMQAAKDSKRRRDVEALLLLAS